MQLVINSSRMLCALRLHNVSLLNIRINSKERVIIKNRIGYPEGEHYPEYVMKTTFHLQNSDASFPIRAPCGVKSRHASERAELGPSLGSLCQEPQEPLRNLGPWGRRNVTSNCRGFSVVFLGCSWKVGGEMCNYCLQLF